MKGQFFINLENILNLSNYRFDAYGIKRGVGDAENTEYNLNKTIIIYLPLEKIDVYFTMIKMLSRGLINLTSEAR